MSRIRNWMMAVSMLALCTRATSAGPAEDFVAAGLEARAKTKAIQAEMRTAGGDSTNRAHMLQMQARALAKPAPKPREIANMARQLAMYRRRVEDMKRRIRDMEQAIELAKFADPKARAAKAKELQAEAKKLTLASGQAMRPYFDRMRQVKKELAESTGYRADALKPYFLNPTQKHPKIATMKIRASTTSGAVSCCWRAANNAIIAEATLEVVPMSKFKSRKLLANTYPLGYVNDQYLVVTAGYFRVRLSGSDKKLQGKDNIQQAVQDFVDLKGLAAIKPTAAAK